MAADATDQIERARLFRPYAEYKDSGVEWLGAIPRHWGVERLKYLATLNDESLAESTDPNFEMNYVDIGSVDPVAGITEAEPVSFANAPSRARRVVREGDVIVSTVRTYLRAITAIEAPEPNLIVSTGFAVFRPRRIASSFASYALRAPYFVDRVVSNSVGVSYPAINAESLSCFPIACPDVNEQHAIADFLDRETAKIDALVAKKERLIELLQEKRSALITRAVTQGLDPNVAMKDSVVEWLGETPAHWDKRKVKRLFRHTKRQGFADMTVLSVYREYGVIDKSSRDDNFNRTPEDLDTYQLVNPGDLVINKMKAWQGSLGISPLSGITSPDYLVYAPIHSVNERFIHHFLRCKLLASVYLTMSNGIRPSQWRLEPGRFGDLMVLIPPPEEQNQVAAFLDGETTDIDALITNVRKVIDHLKELRTALISAAVTGKIDVREAPR